MTCNSEIEALLLGGKGAYPKGVAGVAPPPLKYICSQQNSGNRTSEDAWTFFFFCLHLILGGKLDVRRL